MPNSKRIVVSNDHAIYRQAVVEFLKTQGHVSWGVPGFGIEFRECFGKETAPEIANITYHVTAMIEDEDDTGEFIRTLFLSSYPGW